MLEECERENILLDFNKTDANYPSDKTVHQLFVITSYSIHYTKLYELEDLLDSGETPVVHTYHPRLPFNNGYISLDDISVKPEESWHFFLMVGHDKENFYYVDSPNFMNMQNYEHHPENRSVGVLKKSTLLKAFEVFAHFIVMEINMKALLDIV